eukprot:GILK01001989.1.p1 GENE.GILK01001989.1~~GILK01001989.1.p1  ORF type:complete len:605 (+),score=181.67 GILK01001989.1:56-1816(+)
MESEQKDSGDEQLELQHGEEEGADVVNEVEHHEAQEEVEGAAQEVIEDEHAEVELDGQVADAALDDNYEGQEEHILEREQMDGSDADVMDSSRQDELAEMEPGDQEEYDAEGLNAEDSQQLGQHEHNGEEYLDESAEFGEQSGEVFDERHGHDEEEYGERDEENTGEQEVYDGVGDVDEANAEDVLNEDGTLDAEMEERLRQRIEAMSDEDEEEDAQDDDQILNDPNRTAGSFSQAGGTLNGSATASVLGLNASGAYNHSIDGEEREYMMSLEEALAIRERLSQENMLLQRRVITYYQKNDSGMDKSADATMNEHRYLNTLNSVYDKTNELHQLREHYSRQADDMRDRLADKEAKAGEIRESFREFKSVTAKCAVNSRTGKSIPGRVVSQFEGLEAEKDDEVNKVRLKNIALRNQLLKLEKILRKKDELADGLHLIDFEQLKIENQTLNEKIEERNEELHKLRKKTVTTVQVLTHIKEKLQFVQAENQVLQSELSGLDDNLSHERDTLSKTKHERDELRLENGRLRQQTGIANSDLLTKDFETRNNEINRLRQRLRELKDRHAKLTGIVNQANRISKHTQEAVAVL